MKLIVLSIVFFFCISSVSAVQFSPSQLSFTLTDDETHCEKLYVETETPTTITDVWAESYASEWRISTFDFTSESFGISVSAPATIPAGENDIEICFTGTNPDFAKGAIVFKQETIGNSLIQFAIWVDISVPDQIKDSNGESSSRSSSRRSIQRSSVFEENNAQFISQRRTVPEPEVPDKTEDPIVLNSRQERAAYQFSYAPFLLTSILVLVNVLLITILTRKVYK